MNEISPEFSGTYRGRCSPFWIHTYNALGPVRIRNFSNPYVLDTYNELYLALKEVTHTHSLFYAFSAMIEFKEFVLFVFNGLVSDLGPKALYVCIQKGQDFCQDVYFDFFFNVDLLRASHTADLALIWCEKSAPNFENLICSKVHFSAPKCSNLRLNIIELSKHYHQKC